ncbi:U11/U12 small nuclear ribonucleoprotein 25 kDa protein-like isoform X1 [Penaeus japonicus]|uniref:U11/U12 small nuclear ribonucleoprotein 25 kDa protein-like isoform X1 n=1 Tax=Penaeus japonicus TaxID=27405 RepID=UPI001C711EDD|nr:U11/U12 small nuclear ribonucleoprotein 25 kDa protein-like isoform X1 [Penaeus japonicus]
MEVNRDDSRDQHSLPDAEDMRAGASNVTLNEADVTNPTDKESHQFSDEGVQPQQTESMDSETLSHAELKKFFQEALCQLLKKDPVLNDLHPQVTLEEVNALIELEHGRAMKVYVEKADGGFWSVVVPREATVHDLKKALKNHVALMLTRKGAKKKINWKYIWKTYWLCHEGEKMTDDWKKLLELGVKNKSSLTFLKRLRERHKSGRKFR